MKKWFLICFFLSSVSFSSEMRLKEKFSEAQPGSYLVTEQNKTFTFLHINDRNQKVIVIEEVSIPASRFAQAPMPWKQWFESGAPGHTSWIMSQISLESGRFEETFSFVHGGWVDFSDSNAFLSTLLNLSFVQIPENQRKRIGLAPGYNKPDYRPLWNPRMKVDGMIISHMPFTAWKTRWPADGTELSRKIIEIYLPKEISDSNLPQYPSFFPYWIEIEGKLGSAKARVIDSGSDAQSPKGSIPLKAPRLVGENWTESGLELLLSSPAYFHEFEVMAEEVDSFGKIFPIPFQCSIKEGQLCLFLCKEVLEQQLAEKESYRFLISLKDNPALCLETKRAFSLSMARPV